MKFDNDYKKLAYEKAAILALVGLAHEFLLPPEGEEDAQRRLECEELGRGDCEVPEDAIIDVVMKLQRLAKNRELEMSKYAHVLVENNDEQEWSEEEKPATLAGSKNPSPRPGKGKKKGGGGGAQAAAARGGGQKPAHPGAAQPGGGPAQRA